MQQRQYYFDVLKGIAIFMVVLGHIIEYCMTGCQTSAPFRLISRIHMPLFFFISGWFSFGLIDNGDMKYPRLGRRFMQLMVPGAVVSVLMVMAAPYLPVRIGECSSLPALWSTPGKCGYWFNPVLFEIIVIYALIIPVLNRFRGFAHRACLVLGVYIMLFVIQRYIAPPVIRDAMSLNAVMVYWIPFVAGVLARCESGAFFKALESPGYMTAVTLVLIGSLYCVCWGDTIGWLPDPSVNIIRPLAHVALAFLAVALVRPWCSGLQSPGSAGPVCRMWITLGVNSLGIYLLHFFFLFPIGRIQSLIGIQSGDTVAVLMLAAIVAMAVIAVVMLIIYILRPARYLSRMIIGA